MSAAGPRLVRSVAETFEVQHRTRAKYGSVTVLATQCHREDKAACLVVRTLYSWVRLVFDEFILHGLPHE